MRNLSWKLRGGCSSLSYQEADRIFFPDNGKLTTEATALCSACPVRQQCGESADGEMEGYGSFAGEAAADRRERLGITLFNTPLQVAA